ncbi:hypothetical protein GE21DRAFT_1221896 [Neurospora crassa]|nr:hypothetical protein GE21DRAFT_1221896 [Neurospora crassa]
MTTSILSWAYIILSQIRQGSSSDDKTSATGLQLNKGGTQPPWVDRNDKTKPFHAKGLTPMERFGAERFGDGSWHNVNTKELMVFGHSTVICMLEEQRSSWRKKGRKSIQGTM